MSEGAIRGYSMHNLIPSGNWLVADTTKGFFLEYWLFPECKCVVSLKADVELETMEALMRILQACEAVPR